MFAAPIHDPGSRHLLLILIPEDRLAIAAMPQGDLTDLHFGDSQCLWFARCRQQIIGKLWASN